MLTYYFTFLHCSPTIVSRCRHILAASTPASEESQACRTDYLAKMARSGLDWNYSLPRNDRVSSSRLAMGWNPKAMERPSHHCSLCACECIFDVHGSNGSPHLTVERGLVHHPCSVGALSRRSCHDASVYPHETYSGMFGSFFISRFPLT